MKLFTLPKKDSTSLNEQAMTLAKEAKEIGPLSKAICIASFQGDPSVRLASTQKFETFLTTVSTGTKLWMQGRYLLALLDSEDNETKLEAKNLAKQLDSQLTPALYAPPTYNSETTLAAYALGYLAVYYALTDLEQYKTVKLKLHEATLKQLEYYNNPKQEKPSRVDLMWVYNMAIWPTAIVNDGSHKIYISMMAKLDPHYGVIGNIQALPADASCGWFTSNMICFAQNTGDIVLTRLLKKQLPLAQEKSKQVHDVHDLLLCDAMPVFFQRFISPKPSPILSSL